MQRGVTCIHCVLISMLAMCCLSVTAQESPAQETESKAAWQAAGKAMLRGPQEIALRNQATLKLPDGYGFIPKNEGARVMQAMGNETDSRFMGLILPLGNGEHQDHWFVTVDYESAGYIKDDDAKKWDANELLNNLKEGTEAGNKQREKMGIPDIQVTRWIQPPTYNGLLHHLVWSAEARLKNGDDPDPTINYNTYVLGREGYISMDLITATSTIDQDKNAAQTLLSATEFNSGKRYTDFNSSTDKIAEYGLAALVGGVVLKKIGLLAVIGAFLLKFAKIIFITVAAAGGGMFKRFRRKKDDASTTASSSTSSTLQLAAPTEVPAAEDKPPA